MWTVVFYSWWSHARPTEKNKGERLAIRLLAQNLESDNTIDKLNVKNKTDIIRLHYDSET